MEHPEDTQEVFDKYYDQERLLGEVKAKDRELVALKARVEKSEAFKRLEQNADFKIVIEEGFIKSLGANTIKALGQCPDARQEADLLNVIRGIGLLQAHFEGIMQLGAHAAMNIPRLADELAGLRSIN